MSSGKVTPLVYMILGRLVKRKWKTSRGRCIKDFLIRLVQKMLLRKVFLVLKKKKNLLLTPHSSVLTPL